MARSRSKESIYTLELEVAPGLQPLVVEEVTQRLGDAVLEPPTILDDALRCRYRGDLHRVLGLQTVIAAYLVEVYALPRPKAFLGHQHLTRLLGQIETARRVTGSKNFGSLYLNAAGSHTSVMQRLKTTLGEETGLQVREDEGDLLLRMRRALSGDGWEVLVRLSARPLATRDWRVVDLPGALNASVANAMTRLMHPLPDEVVLNPLCGSGTFMIERLRHTPAARVLGCDTSAEARLAAYQNIEAAHLSDAIELFNWDARKLPLADQSVDVLYADLPFGNLVGTHQTNRTLYPGVLGEAARVARPGAAFVTITQEIQLLDEVLARMPQWTLERSLRITLSGLHPRIDLLRRTES